MPFATRRLLTWPAAALLAWTVMALSALGDWSDQTTYLILVLTLVVSAPIAMLLTIDLPPRARPASESEPGTSEAHPRDEDEASKVAIAQHEEPKQRTQHAAEDEAMSSDWLGARTNLWLARFDRADLKRWPPEQLEAFDRVLWAQNLAARVLECLIRDEPAPARRQQASHELLHTWVNVDPVRFIEDAKDPHERDVLLDAVRLNVAHEALTSLHGMKMQPEEGVSIGDALHQAADQTEILATTYLDHRLFGKAISMEDPEHFHTATLNLLRDYLDRTGQARWRPTRRGSQPTGRSWSERRP